MYSACSWRSCDVKPLSSINSDISKLSQHLILLLLYLLRLNYDRRHYSIITFDNYLDIVGTATLKASVVAQGFVYISCD